MPLEAPDLDTRTFDQIFDELRRRIPGYTPDWTDFNESDPGITLLQLFSWLTEMILRQLNQVPERHYIKFLQLIGLELRPARPAEADVEFTPRAGTPVAPIPAGSRLAAQPASGGDPLIFETETGLSVIGVPLTDVQVWDGTDFTVVSAENETEGRPFRPLGVAPQVGNAVLLGFTPPDLPTERPFPQDLRFRVFRPITTRSGAPERGESALAPPAPPVTLVWEYLPTPTALRWRRLSLFEDETAALTREGYVVVEGPAEIEAATVGNVAEERFWLRCRLERGGYPAGRIPEIEFLRPNTVRALNLSTVTDEIEGISDGRPGQIHRLRRVPVAPSTLVLETELDGAGRARWERRDDLLASGARDRHYVLNENKGEIRFGDGRNGEIPLAGSDIVARTYRHGGGLAGNVGPAAITTAVTTLLGIESVTNRRPAVGGSDEQDVEELKAQAPRMLRRRGRAVTGEDFVALAGEVGGVLRATALPLAHPDHPGVAVPGTVTVVVVPDDPESPRPEPSADLLRVVRSRLEEHRLITTEVFVAGPAYRRVTVQARVAAQPYAAAGTVEQAVRERLRVALDPRTRGFGLDFHPTSLYADIVGATDVVAVEWLSVSVDGVPHGTTDPVIVAPGALVYGDGHEIRVTPAQDL